MSELDKWVSFDDFLSLVGALRQRHELDSELAVAFKLFDAADKGRITLADLRTVVRRGLSARAVATKGSQAERRWTIWTRG